MNRLVGSGYREAIQAAQERIGETIMARLAHVGFVCGVDPHAIGLIKAKSYTFKDGTTIDYADLAATGYGYHTPDRQTTIFLPRDFLRWVRFGPERPVETVIHEYGHALHETLLWEPAFEPVTLYAAESRAESFAEAFMSWVMPTQPWQTDTLNERAPEAVALFERLAAGDNFAGL